MKKSFRGRLADGALERIRLSTNNGLTGYQIVKFELMGHNPGDTSSGSYEHVVQIFTTENIGTGVARTASGTVDFTDPTLLAAGLCFANTSPQFNDETSVIFDNTKFNQDIFITHVNEDTATDVNYYLELEQVKLSENEATVATLKDMRASE